ncbi:MAG: hypothetical protein ACK2UV_01220 [Candidatus Promineifilaceae bacterium]|jgi:hypothetical protein
MKNLTSLGLGETAFPDSLRVFWKIIVEGNGDSLRAVKEMALWGQVERDGLRVWNRLLWKQIPLQVEIGPPDRVGRHRDHRVISVEDGYIFFKGGYLKIWDTSLVEDLRVSGREIDPANAGASAVTGVLGGEPPSPGDDSSLERFIKAVQNSSEAELELSGDNPQFIPGDTYKEQEEPRPSYYAGYNVRVEVEYGVDRARDGLHPLFYYPQDPERVPQVGFIELDIEKSSDEHQLVWQISNSGPLTPSLYCLEEFHLATVNQETEGDDKPLFEFLADAIPLGKEGDSGKDSHLFSKFGRYFYVGYSPEADERIFRGYIKRLMFDPNAGCFSC